MERRDFVKLPLVPVAALWLPGQRPPTRPVAQPAGARPVFAAWLAANLARYHTAFDVYTDDYAAGNHFPARGRIYADERKEAEPVASAAVPPMDEAHRILGRPGTCVRARFVPAKRDDFGGWYLMNGVLTSRGTLCDGTVAGPAPVDGQGAGVEPVPNWGTEPNAGFGLRGATELSFWAAGAKGGERVKFFALGVGWRNGVRDPAAPFGDSTKAVEVEVRLSRSWERYTMSLSRLDLSYVLGGFGWVAASGDNGGHPVEFFFDDVRYDKARLEVPRLPLSYDTGDDRSDFGMVMRNVAFTYDAAVAAIAFLAVGDVTNAVLIAEALRVAQEQDRSYCDFRLRNAYQAGDLTLPPGWTPNGRINTVRMPGWYGPDQRTGKNSWFEDRFTVSSHTGNLAWAILAWLSVYEAAPRVLPLDVRRKYLDAAVKLGHWVECNCTYEGPGNRAGYTGGFNGWEGATEKIGYRSTEHNIDLVSAFSRLGQATSDRMWEDCAERARTFVESMWHDGTGAEPGGPRFWTGTLGVGDDINRNPVPVDAQAWAVLALGPRGRSGEPYVDALGFAERRCRSGDGFSFSTADTTGIWYEGTAQMSVAYRVANRDGDASKADAILTLLRNARDASGAMPATNVRALNTGFEALPGIKWYYYPRPHTGATAWAVLAERRVNPFARFAPL
jgi:hypothetical protein